MSTHAPIVYDPAELQRLDEARRERELRWSQPGYRQAMERAFDNAPAPLPTNVRDGGGPERQRVIAQLRKTEQRLAEIDNQQAVGAALREKAQHPSFISQFRTVDPARPSSKHRVRAP